MRKIPYIPVAWGEVFDKITILEIKLERLPSKSLMIEKELRLLNEVANAVVISRELALLLQDLKEVNLKLWRIEDEIRVHEREGCFDSEFIKLARRVYITNDRRYEIKSAINQKFGSEIREEKSYEDYR